MATLILTAAGQALGGGVAGLLGLSGIGATLGAGLGKAAGAVLGSTLDQQLFGSSRTVETGRLEDLSVQASSEGASLPKLYGRMRVAGQVIWATRYEEEVSEEKQGGKGGGGSVTVKSYRYFGNFALALSEGPISRVGRIWADGKPLDTSGLTWRLYKGDEMQDADPLILAHQGQAPAYRGTAYVVFEHLPLEPFGNRLPQLTFEVVRSVEPLERQIRAVTLIPSAGEFIYQPTRVSARPSPGVTETLNRHDVSGASDWQVSLDELTALCPNLESVALVVAWFGDDLRAGTCEIRPKVEDRVKETAGATWSVAGLERAEAEEVSRLDGGPAYGGTPSDASILAAIADLKARGLKVLLYPFVLMDIAPGNGLPDPKGGSEQPAYPWRGRIVPAGATAEATGGEMVAEVAAEAASFFGQANPGDFGVSGGSPVYTGPADWRYRRFILHMAHLAKAAGGVDAFLIGSEMRGLTRAHAGGGLYPFVEGLKTLAEDVRDVLGETTRLSYAADWSEYGAHQVATDELRFPLDRLWASSAVDFVGIDCYLPIADQRPQDETGPYDVEQLRQGVTSGEYHDWYYAGEADRQAGIRTSISDGAYGKPWVYRAKDLAGWWENAHVERVGGVELAEATDWVPASKPIWLTELGFPAIDRGANQPNVFVDPKSSESAFPYFSSGHRDDLLQRRALEAVLSVWEDNHPDHGALSQPVSQLYGGPMLEPGRIYLWTWDARPFPAFPLYENVWSDGENWRLGHWLTGRLGTVSLAGVLRQIFRDQGLPLSLLQVADVSGMLEGLAVAGPISPRSVIEPLMEAFGVSGVDAGTHLRFQDEAAGALFTLAPDHLAEPDPQAPVLSRTLSQASEMPSEVRFLAASALDDYRRRVASSRRLAAGSGRVESLSLAASVDPEALQQAAGKRLARIWDGRERVDLALSPELAGLEPGDRLSLSELPGESFDPPLQLRVDMIEDGFERRIEARRSGVTQAVSGGSAGVSRGTFVHGEPGLAEALFLDLPLLRDSDPDAALRLACFAKPWPGGISVLRSADGSGYQSLIDLEQPTVIGRLTADLNPGPLGYWDRLRVVELEVFGGLLQSRSAPGVLSGLNAMAIRKPSGDFEILQFREAELTGLRRYRLSGLLRGQRGTEAEALETGETGADCVLLEPDRVPLVPLSRDQIGLELQYRLVPSGLALDDERVSFLSHAATGRGFYPLAPVHLRAKRSGEGVHLSWIRQTRRGGDGWEQGEVPLGEDREAYQLEVLSGAGDLLHSLTVSEPKALYSLEQELVDFGQIQNSLTVRVAQVSATAGPGFFRKEVLNV